MLRLWIVLAAICAVYCSISDLNPAANDPEERRTNNYGYVEYKKELVSYINSLNTTWKATDIQADVNRRFHGKSFPTVRRLMGCVRKRADRPKLPILRLKHLLGDESIPKSFDAREQWPQCPTIAEIRDQSNCGSCWAFGATEAMSDRVCIASKGLEKPHISADDLLACCKDCGNGCFGGDPRSAWQFWVDQGLVTGGNYTTHSGCLPYPFPPCDHHVNGTLKPCPHKLNPTPKCIEKCQSAYTKTYSEDKYFGKQAYSVEEHVQSIQKELMTRGPVEAAFEVYEDFEFYKSGVYQHHKGESMGGHAVRIIGWGEDERTGTPYWLVANSWNTEWGEKGLFRIKRGSNECGIEDDITAGTPKLNDMRSSRYYSNLDQFLKYDRE